MRSNASAALILSFVPSFAHIHTHTHMHTRTLTSTFFDIYKFFVSNVCARGAIRVEGNTMTFSYTHIQFVWNRIASVAPWKYRTSEIIVIQLNINWWEMLSKIALNWCAIHLSNSVMCGLDCCCPYSELFFFLGFHQIFNTEILSVRSNWMIFQGEFHLVMDFFVLPKIENDQQGN